MKLLMLTKFYPYGTGEAFIENEINVLSKYYEDITIIACEVPRGEKRIRKIPDNVNVYRIPSKNKMPDRIKGICKNIIFPNSDIKNEKIICKTMIQRCFLYYFEEKSQRIFNYIVKNNMLDTIMNREYVLYSYWFFVTARVGTLISNYKKPAYMFSRAHRYDLYEERNSAGYLPFRKLLLASYDTVYPCSNDGALYLKNKYPQFSGKIETAFLGTLDHGIGSESRDDVFRVVSCSRIAPEKRVEKIINALSILDSESLNIQWTHIGSGDNFEKLKRNACNKLKNTKCYFLGNQPNSEVLNIYRREKIDLFLNVSSSEGLPVSIMEAMSFGIPTLATDVGGTCEIVRNGFTGQLIEENFSDKELAKQIKKFYNLHMNKEDLIYRTNCRAYWEEYFQAIPNYNKLCCEIKEKMLNDKIEGK